LLQNECNLLCLGHGAKGFLHRHNSNFKQRSHRQAAVVFYRGLLKSRAACMQLAWPCLTWQLFHEDTDISCKKLSLLRAPSRDQAFIRSLIPSQSASRAMQLFDMTLHLEEVNMTSMTWQKSITTATSCRTSAASAMLPSRSLSCASLRVSLARSIST